MTGAGSQARRRRGGVLLLLALVASSTSSGAGAAAAAAAATPHGSLQRPWPPTAGHRHQQGRQGWCALPRASGGSVDVARRRRGAGGASWGAFVLPPLAPPPSSLGSASPALGRIRSAGGGGSSSSSSSSSRAMARRPGSAAAGEGEAPRTVAFAPFKTGTLGRLLQSIQTRPVASTKARTTTTTLPAVAPAGRAKGGGGGTAGGKGPTATTTTTKEKKRKAASALSSGLRQIWDAVQGVNGPGGLEGGESSGGSGDNTAFKVMLATVAMVYGTNFGAIKYLDEANVDVSIVTAIRFFLAAAALAPFLFKARKEVIERGLEVGAWVAFGYLTQAIGLQDTEASKSAFICSLSVVVVPIVNAIVYGRRLTPTTAIASLLAVVGVGMLTLEGDMTPSVGDLWSLGQPLGFGVAFVRTEQCMSENKDQALAMTAAQMLGVFICAAIWVSVTLTAKTPDLSILWEPVHAAALVYTGLVTSALAVVAESVALAHISAEETTVILSTEPLWAALFGAVVLGEKLGGEGYVGAAIILAACLLTQTRLPAGIEGPLRAILGSDADEEAEDAEA